MANATATKTVDRESQIRIIRRVDKDDASVIFSVEHGFYIKRGSRHVWYTERRGVIGYFDTLAQAEVAASDPKLIARRDDIRRRRGDAPIAPKASCHFCKAPATTGRAADSGRDAIQLCNDCDRHYGG